MITRYYGSFLERRLPLVSKICVKNCATAATQNEVTKPPDNTTNRWTFMSTILETRGFIEKPAFSFAVKHNGGSNEWGVQLEVKFRHNNRSVKISSDKLHTKKSDARREVIGKMIDLLEKVFIKVGEILNTGLSHIFKKYKLSDLTLELIKNRKPLQYPKGTVLAFYKFKGRVELPEIVYEQCSTQSEGLYWKGSLTIDWPFKYHSTEFANSKSQISNVLFQRLAEEFQKAGIFDEKYEFNKVDKREIFNQHGVVDHLSLKIDQEMKLKIVKLKESCDQLEELIKSAPQSKTDDNIENDSDNLTSIDDDLNEPCVVSSGETIDIITGRPLSQLIENREKLDRRNEILSAKLSKLNDEAANEYVRSMMHKRSNLPIFSKKHEILELIDKNRIIVLKGETGCGKTTQLPQYILEHFIQKNRGSEANIIVTQPRRLSAVSVAQRIADERFESLGDTVGYRIRLGNKKPAGNGSIYFTTPGMLLRSRMNNMDFKGISHIIIDEVHERDMWTDFLLICLKRALISNPDLKLILMSATIATEKFQKYFEDCPLIEVSGRTFPVEERFLDDLEISLSRKIDQPMQPKNLSFDLLNGRSKVDTDIKTVVQMLRHIHETHEPGAILCFLPTSGDIRKVQDLLIANHDPSLLILPCHSRLSVNDQQKVFENAPQGQRKLVLATNIAETSITIDDVKYVVNTGTCKSEVLDGQSKVLRAVEMWSSQAAQKQRKGRAGRVSQGICYHMFPKDFMSRFEEHSHPELRTKPLTNLILFAKLYCPDEDPGQFLSEALEPPHDFQINAAVDELIDLNFLDKDRNLTPLGRRLAGLGCSPYLAKAMLYSIFLKCSDSVLSIASMLELNSDVFINSPDIDRSLVNRAKLEQMGSKISDHLLLAEIYERYKQYLKVDDKDPENEQKLRDFCEKNFLDAQALNLASNLKSLFSKQLQTAGIVEKNEDLLRDDSDFNKNKTNDKMIIAALTAGLGKNVLKLSINNTLVQNLSNLKSSNIGLLDCEGRYNIQLKAGALDLLAKTLNDNRINSKYANDKPSNSNQSTEKHDVFWFNTFERVLSVDGRSFRVIDLGLVDPLLVLLFSGFDLEAYGCSNLRLQPSKDFRFQFSSAEERDQVILLRQLSRQLIDLTCRVGLGTKENEGIIDKLKDTRQCYLSILNEIVS